MTRMRKNIEEDVIVVSRTDGIDVPYTDKPNKSTNGYGGIFEEDDIVEQPEDDDPDESDLNNMEDVSYTGNPLTPKKTWGGWGGEEEREEEGVGIFFNLNFFLLIDCNIL